MNTKPKQQSLARDLYFNTNLSQAAIAAYVGVSKKTVCLWVNEGNWNRLRMAMFRMPSMLVEEMYAQLQEMGHNIRSRIPGTRYPTWHEADVMRKLVWCIIKLRQNASVGESMESITAFCQHIARKDPELATKLEEHTASFMEEKLDQTHVPTDIDYMDERDMPDLEEYFEQRAPGQDEQDMKKDMEDNEQFFSSEEEFKKFCEDNNIPYFPSPPKYTVK
jgi:hypothetical protein